MRNILTAFFVAFLTGGGLYFCFASGQDQLPTGRVVINEIGWSGTKASAADEWIELFNNSSSTIDLAGWRLYAQDGSPDIKLKGSIAPGGFYLLERTDDDTISDIKADQIYTGALKDSGETLILKDDAGLVEDKVSKWYSGGGKERFSMERKNPKERGDKQDNWASNDGIIKNGLDKDGNPVLGTPRQTNSVSQGSSTVPFKQTASSSTSSEINVAGPNGLQPESQVQIGIKKKGEQEFKVFDKITAFTGQSIDFKVLGGKFSESYLMNFGNGKISSGRNFSYSFSFPGKYIVSLYSGQDSFLPLDQTEVEILPRGILINEFMPNPEGADKGKEWVEFFNGSGASVDIRDFVFSPRKDGRGGFTFPKGTFIFPRSFLVVSSADFSFSLPNHSGHLFLFYPDGEIAERISYFDAPEGYSAARVGDKFFWSSKPTPGYSNVVNPIKGENPQEVGSLGEGQEVHLKQDKTYALPPAPGHDVDFKKFPLGNLFQINDFSVRKPELGRKVFNSRTVDTGGQKKPKSTLKPEVHSGSGLFSKDILFRKTHRQLILLISIVIFLSLMYVSFSLRKRKAALQH